MTPQTVNDGVLFTVMVNSGRRVRLGYHNRGTDIIGFVDDCTLPDHAFALAGVCLQFGGPGNLDWGSHLDIVWQVT